MSELNQVKQEIADISAKMYKVNFFYRLILKRKLKSRYRNLSVLRRC